MAHTAEVDSWDYDDDYDDNADALEEMEVASLQELHDEPDTITIKVKFGTRGLYYIEERLRQEIAKRGVPDGYQYEVLDHDVESEPIREALYLATVNILVRATSPECAVDTIYRVMIDQDVVDWDYAVQDGERQLPKCVNLDLEPESITELLDHIAT